MGSDAGQQPSGATERIDAAVAKLFNKYPAQASA